MSQLTPSANVAFKPKVLITHRFDLQVYLVAQTQGHLCIHYNNDLKELRPHFPHCQGLILRSKTQVNQKFLKLFPKLQVIVTATSGFDHMDLKALEEKNIKAFHTPEAPVESTAELTLLMLLACCRKLPQATGQLQGGVWDRHPLLGRQLRGLRLGIIGLGRVGKKVAQKAQSLGLKVAAFDPYLETPEGVEMLGFEELMRNSDAVSLHVPQTRYTRHMIFKQTLEWMSPNGILLNMCRGDVVHENDLIHHLSENREFYAGLDVFAREPLSLKSDLHKLPNVCLTPHLGANTRSSLKQSSQQALDTIYRFFKGESPPHPLPPKALWWTHQLKNGI